VADSHLDRVRARAQIGIESPLCENKWYVGLISRVKTCHALALGEACTRTEIGETFLEPEIVPPLHRDEVAEPHVGKLVDGDAPVEQLLILCNCVAIDEDAVGQADNTHVLHAANAELRHVHLVVLRIRELGLEECLIEANALVHDPELLVSVEVGDFAGAAEDAHGDLRLRLARMLNHVILAGAEAVNVRTDWRARCKVPHHPAVAQRGQDC